MKSVRSPLNRSMPVIQLSDSPDWQDYVLLDSGNGSKLEQYGPYRLWRPEPEAVWKPLLPDREWQAADAVFKVTAEENGGHWEYRRPLPERWPMRYKNLRFYAMTTASRHVGVFPEQASQWDWIEDQVHAAGRPLQVLNLFGYTGLASLAAAQAGAKVTHLDASRKAIGWAKDNQTLSALDAQSIRWILDDAVKFVYREGRRGAKYDGLILDPPKFGRGPKGEVWEFYKLIPDLLSACKGVLSDQAQFIVLTAYAVKASALTLYNGLDEIMDGRGQVSAGEVVLQEKSGGRYLSLAVYGRWSANR
jgi:23S rRNA (cytosine1962-C5)-methyltransferase